MKKMTIQLQVAEERHLAQLLDYVRAYHEFEAVALTDEERTAAIHPLLGESPFGRIWLICLGSESIGYIALCFGYSIEFVGRDAFIDEMFIVPEHRKKGHGKAALNLAKLEAARLGVGALHLEVARANETAQHSYRVAGFYPREKYFLMSTLIERTAAQQSSSGNLQYARARTEDT